MEDKATFIKFANIKLKILKLHLDKPGPAEDWN